MPDGRRPRRAPAPAARTAAGSGPGRPAETMTSGRCAAMNPGDASRYWYPVSAFGPRRAPEDGSARTGHPPAPPARRARPRRSRRHRRRPRPARTRAAQAARRTRRRADPRPRPAVRAPGKRLRPVGVREYRYVRRGTRPPHARALRRPVPESSAGTPAGHPRDSRPARQPEHRPGPALARCCCYQVRCGSGTRGSRKGRLRWTGPGSAPSAPAAFAQARQARDRQ